METSKKSVTNIVGGLIYVLCALFAVLSAWSLYKYEIIEGQAMLWLILGIAAYAVISIALFAKKQSPLLVVGFVILAILTIRSMYGYCQSGYLYYFEAGGGGLYTRSFHFSIMIQELLVLGTYVVAVIITLMLFAGDVNKKNTARKFWFIPAALYAVSVLLGIIPITSSLHIESIVCVVGIFFAMMWIAYPDGMPQKTIVSSDGTVIAAVVPEEEGYCGLVKHVLLLLFTFGVWYLIWIYKMTAYLNRVEDEEPRNPTTKLLLCMFIPFYSIYWVYKSAHRIDKLANRKGIQSDLSPLCLILAIFVGIIPPILMQDKINTITTTKAGFKAKQDSAQDSAVASTQHNIVEELRQIKELFDSGVITQEEFDAKKKQILGL